MRVLLLADDDGLYGRGADTLRRAGHEVVGCHEAGAAADRWPCSGVEATCPLDDGVDAAVALRRSSASRVEAGVGCVVRQKVPLVLGGVGDEGVASGVAPYAAEVIDGVGPELVEAVRSAVATPSEELSGLASAAVRETATRLGIEGTFAVEVHRERRAIKVAVQSSVELDSSQRAALSQAAFAPVRETVPGGAVTTIDVAFADPTI